MERPKPDKEPNPEELNEIFATEGEALKLIEDFWRAMPHGTDIIHAVEVSGGGWGQELTMGDRTTARQVKLPGPDKGKWRVRIYGNHQPLTNEAIVWLKEKGHL